MKQDKLWTDEEVAYLREMVPTGISYRAIGEKIGRTKSSTIAKAKRLGIAGLAPKKEVWNKGLSLQIQSKKKSVKPKPEKKPASYFSQTSEYYQCVAVDPPADAQNLSFADMRHGQCWYPEGDVPAEMTFCGASTLPGSSYCAYHRRIVYVPYQPAKRPSLRAYR